MLRIVLMVLLVCIALPARAADGGYFIAVGEVNTERAQDYETFLEKVAPVWGRHGMGLVLRAKTRFVLEAQGEPVPTDIAVLRYESRAGFNAYLRDPDYEAIKDLRTGAMESLAIMEAQAGRMDGLKFIANTPMALVQFSGQPTELSAPAFVLKVDLVAPVKGDMAQGWRAVRQVHFMPLTFEDNPMAAAGAGALLTLAGDLER